MELQQDHDLIASLFS